MSTGPQDALAAPAALRALVDFAHTLRHAGVDACPARVHAMIGALGALDAADPRALYWAGRLTLCAQPDDLPRYDDAFAAFFGTRAGSPTAPVAGPAPARSPVALLAAAPGDLPRTDDLDGNGVTELPLASASRAEVLRHRDVAALSSAERDEIRRLLGLLAPAAGTRRTRRRGPAPRGEVDVRRSVRQALRHAGELRLLRRRRLDRPRRLVLLLDVSGSMTPYADALLRFAHAAVRQRPTRTEVFTVGTRLTWVTRGLRHRDPDAALRAAGAAIPDWRGGTRLADGLRAFLDRWGRRGTARGAIVVICSDGWERGDPAPLATQVDRIGRLAHRLIWVNPHRGKAGYAPLAGGMAAALPYLDDFVAGHSLAALEELVEVIARA